MKLKKRGRAGENVKAYVEALTSLERACGNDASAMLRRAMSRIAGIHVVQFVTSIILDPLGRKIGERSGLFRTFVAMVLLWFVEI